MRQTFDRTLTVPAAGPELWETVADVERVLSWFSIVGDVTAVEPGSRYATVLRDRLGPFQLRADLAITVGETEERRRLTATASGEDRQLGSRIGVDVELVLDDADEETALRVRGHYEVTGRPATLGASSIRKKAARILDEFFLTAQRELAGASPGCSHPSLRRSR